MKIICCFTAVFVGATIAPPLHYQGTCFAQSSRKTSENSAARTIKPLSEERFHQLHAELQPGNEPWLTIPWKIKLLDAQAAAARDGKPIFIWAMDGHPLGCT